MNKSTENHCFTVIINSTYKDKKNKELINDIVGKPYSFIQSFRMHGIGSKRLIIDSVSGNLSNKLNKVSDVNYSNIELRPHGILVFINKGLETFTWAIPFYQLSIYKTEGISIHAQGKFVKYKNNKNYKENKPFFDKLINYKVKFSTNYTPIYPNE